MTGIGSRIAGRFFGALLRVRLIRRLLFLSVVLFVVAMLDLPLPPGPLIDLLVLGALVSWVLRRIRRRPVSRASPAPANSSEPLERLDDARA